MSKSALLLLLLMMLMVKLKNVYGARILLASPHISSHVIMQIAAGEELVQRGHEVFVAVASRYPQPESLEQRGLQTLVYHLPSDAPFGLSGDLEKVIAEHVFNTAGKKIDVVSAVSAMISAGCEFMLSDNKFLEQVRALNFDIALVDPIPVNPCVLLLPYNLNVRFVSLTIFYFPLIIHLPALPSFHRIPGPKFTSSEPTLLNSGMNTIIYIGRHWGLRSLWNSSLLKHYSSRRLTWDELFRKSELFLTTSDHHIYTALPLFPNVIPVPGLTIRPTTPLPDKLNKLAMQSRDGIILVTFGSVASHFPESVVVKFLEALSRLKQTVIAKLSIPEGVSVPKNVHVLRWLPQNDILSHQQTRLFITHCGNNGLYEALYHGVPMLGFPLFAEQSFNCEHACAKGFGLKMNIRNFTSSELFDYIQEILNNKTYSDTIKRSSAIFRDEPLIGPKKAAHLIEHVIKYGSAHLRSAAMDLPLYRFLMLDVLAIFFFVTFVVIAIICVSTRVITRIIWRKLTYQPSQKKLQ